MVVWAIVRRMWPAIDRGCFGRAVVPRATTHHAVEVTSATFGALAWPFGIDTQAGLATARVAVGIPVVHPLPGVAGHVVEAVGIRRARPNHERSPLVRLTPLLLDPAAPA